MQELFLYNNAPRGDVLFSRPLYRRLAETRRFELVIGVCRDDAYLLRDLVCDHTRLAVSDYGNGPWGATVDLQHLRPSGWPAIDTCLRHYEDTQSYQWADVVDVFDSQLRELGIDWQLDSGGDDVPMLDFAQPCAVTAPARPSILVDNCRTADELCYFVFDLRRLAETFADFDLLCTAPPDVAADNLIDCSGLDLIERSALSNHCEVLLGMTRDPFSCTLTEANRFKPKAMCGYDARTCPKFWDYPSNPLEYLATMDEVVDFLLSNLWERAR